VIRGLGLQGKDLTRAQPSCSGTLFREGFTGNVRKVLQKPWVVDHRRKIVKLITEINIMTFTQGILFTDPGRK
jgi:hypothetical protein